MPRWSPMTLACLLACGSDPAGGAELDDVGATGDGETDTSGDSDTGNQPCAGVVAPAGPLAVGQPISHWGGGFTVDGEEWDYCELNGTPFLLILSAGWCGPCQEFAAGLAGAPTEWSTVLEPIRAGLEAGTLSAVDVLVDNFIDFGPPTLQDLQTWEMNYPNDYIHLIGDPTAGVTGEEPLWVYLAPSHGGGLPGGILVDAQFDLEVLTLDEALAVAGSKYGG